MKMKANVLGTSLLLVALCLPGIDAAAADATSDVAALHAVDQAWLKAYTAADGAAAASLYDENAILMPPGAPSAHGRAAIRKFLGDDSAGDSGFDRALLERSGVDQD